MTSNFNFAEKDVLTCFYCVQYQKIIENYPINEGVHDLEDQTPRCNFHWVYRCRSCKKDRHFNGISWCSNCRHFTCVHCNTHKINKKRFLIYTYYYSIECKTCDELNPALDFAEFSMIHPIQTGETKPEGDMNVWITFDSDRPETKDSHILSGSDRIKRLAVGVEFERLDDLYDINPKSVWNANAHIWNENWPEEGDFNHHYIIIPQLLRMVKFEDNKNKDLRVLDVACGMGNLSRKFAKAGYAVQGIDLSRNMLDIAMEKEQKDQLGIEYHLDRAENLTHIFDHGEFDIIYSNMALMDMENLSRTIENISSVIKTGGIFVFSITHPIFAWPIANTIRLPKDSQRNEDKISIVDNYFDTRPTAIHHPKFPKAMLNFPRKISDYINVLVDHSFEIMEMVEPEPSEEVININPRHAFNDYDRTSPFMLIKSRKK